jgi:hypothetical protein
VLIMLFNGTSEGLSRSGEGFILAVWGTVGSEEILPSLDLGRSMILLEAEWMLCVDSPQLTTVVDGDKTYDGAGEFEREWVDPPKCLYSSAPERNRSRSSILFPTSFSLEFIFISRASFPTFRFLFVLLLSAYILIIPTAMATTRRDPTTIL